MMDVNIPQVLATGNESNIRGNSDFGALILKGYSGRQRKRRQERKAREKDTGKEDKEKKEKVT